MSAATARSALGTLSEEDRVNHVASSGAIDDRLPDEPALTPSDDVLDAEVVDRIEELHNAVMVVDGERRSMWGKRAALPTVAEAAEEAYLAAQGFASYTDFRLRIRRTVVAEPSALSALTPIEGVEEPELELSPTDEFRRRVASLLAAFRVDAERLIRVQVEHADRRAVDMVRRATDEAAEMLADANRHHEAVLVSVKKATRRAKRFLAATEVVPVTIGDARQQTAVVLRAHADETVDLAAPVDVDVNDRVAG
jgi:hypothetical protein